MPTKDSAQNKAPLARKVESTATPATEMPDVRSQQELGEAVQRSSGGSQPLRSRDLLQMQRSVGNAATLRRLSIQAKLTVGAAGDRYEQEADQTAQRVLAMPAPTAQRQVKPAASRLPAVQRDAKGDPRGSFEAGAEVESKLAGSKSGGSALPGEVRDYMEPRFGVDFSGVRVHTDGAAAQLNRQLSAQAFTHGNDIYMGEGKSVNDKTLMAHELTHTIQQGAVPQTQRLARKTLAEGISRQNGGGSINRWDDFEHKAFGDLGAQMAMQHDWRFDVHVPRKEHWFREAEAAHTDAIDPTSFGVGSALDEHRKPSDAAGDAKYGQFMDKTNTLKDSLKTQMGMQDMDEGNIGVRHYPGRVGPRWGDKKRMAMGDASMLGGDFHKTPEAPLVGTAGLEEATTVDPTQLADSKLESARMAAIAATNANHFFPLAGMEFNAHYAKAMNAAMAARQLYQNGDQEGGQNTAEKAMLNLGFALHFLQDSFASGHQHPHAFEDVGSALGTAGLAWWGPNCNSFHDVLCALPNGLPVKYARANKNFHGDDFSTSQDYDVARESYHAIGNVLKVLTGHLDYNIPTPEPGQGPDMNRIMNDPANAEARTIWKSMMQYFEEGGASSFLERVKREPDQKEVKDDDGNTKMVDNIYTTSAGTAYFPSDVRGAWANVQGYLGEGQRPTTPKELMIDAALIGRSKLARTKNRKTETELAKEGDPGKEKYVDISVPDKIVRATGDNPAAIPTDLTKNEVVLVMGAMITAPDLSQAHQHWVHQILAAQAQSQNVRDAVNEIGFNNLLGQIKDEGEKDHLLEALAGKGYTGDGFVAKVIERHHGGAADALVGALNGRGAMGEVSHEQWDVLRGLVSTPIYQRIIREHVEGHDGD